MEYKIARGFSVLLHPLLIPGYLLTYLLFFRFYLILSLPAGFKWTLLALVGFTTLLMPLLFTWIFQRLRLISSVSRLGREERIFPLLAVAVFYYITFYLLKGIHFSAIFSFFMLDLTILAILTLIISFYRKISIYLIAIGSITGLFAGFSVKYGVNLNPEILVSVFAAGVAGFARLTATDHKPSEIYWGYALGATVTALLANLV
ncbi:MAG: hypothetical protein PHP04_07155 [Bacteroidales bacterium]|nr:hypothetical protein [Bacteroidales bacterium]